MTACRRIDAQAVHIRYISFQLQLLLPKVYIRTANHIKISMAPGMNYSVPCTTLEPLIPIPPRVSSNNSNTYIRYIASDIMALGYNLPVLDEGSLINTYRS